LIVVTSRNCAACDGVNDAGMAKPNGNAVAEPLPGYVILLRVVETVIYNSSIIALPLPPLSVVMLKFELPAPPPVFAAALLLALAPPPAPPRALVPPPPPA
jgi:hypothetical protein